MENPVTEEMVIRNLVRGFCNDFVNDVIDKIDDFFREYDCRKSLDKSVLTRMIKIVINGLDSIIEELA